MSIRVERRGSIATVTLDRPEADNRLDPDTVRSLTADLDELQRRDAPPDVVVLTATGPDFSLGRDPAGASYPPTPATLGAELAGIQRLNELVQRYPAVTIAKIRGRAFGAGLSLAGRCDLVVAAAGSSLAFPEVLHGLPPTIVLGFYRNVLPRNVLLDLVLTGRVISGADGLAAGLVTRVVEDGDLDEVVDTLADQVASAGPRTLRTIKRFMAGTEGMDPRDAPWYGIEVIVNELVDRSLSCEGPDMRRPAQHDLYQRPAPDHRGREERS